jgi:hypothetical protein
MPSCYFNICALDTGAGTLGAAGCDMFDSLLISCFTDRRRLKFKIMSEGRCMSMQANFWGMYNESKTNN